MFPYWFIFTILATGAIFYQASRVTDVPTAARGTKFPTYAEVVHPALFLGGAILLLVMVGLRYRVGGDWFSYLYMFQRTKLISFWQVFDTGVEPGYVLVNWIAAQLGASIWLVNLICAIPFVWGLVALSKQQPNPWLALLVATPFFVIGVGMGYTRQAAAVGFLLLGLASLARGGAFWRFVAWVLLGALFHRTALVALPIGAMLVTKNLFATWILGGLAAAGSIFTISPEAFAEYSKDYIQARNESAGAGIRLAMNALPAALILLFPQRFHTSLIEKNIWRAWSVIAFIAVAAYFVVPSSVAIDRMSVYVIPVQIYALSRLPNAFASSNLPRLGLTCVIIIYSAVVQFVWFNYANHAKFWIPYRLYTPFTLD